MRKPTFCICENKDADQLRGKTAKLISAFLFATRIVQSFYHLNLKFQASSQLLWLYSPVCVGPGRKPRRSVFSQRGSYDTAKKLRKRTSGQRKFNHYDPHHCVFHIVLMSDGLANCRSIRVVKILEMMK